MSLNLNGSSFPFPFSAASRLHFRGDGVPYNPLGGLILAQASCAIDGSGWRRGERPEACRRARRAAMNDFDECGPSAASMYLPGCAYYVAPSDFASKPSFLSQPSSCQMTFPYSSNLAPHVQPPALRRPNVLGFNDASSLWNFTIPSRGQLGTSQRPLQPEDEAEDLAERILIRGKWRPHLIAHLAVRGPLALAGSRRRRTTAAELLPCLSSRQRPPNLGLMRARGWDQELKGLKISPS
ncbi:hypothetical protein NN561_009185 [Cricetulus griseus]